jgi:hypothetical protein
MQEDSMFKARGKFSRDIISKTNKKLKRWGCCSSGQLLISLKSIERQILQKETRGKEILNQSKI